LEDIFQNYAVNKLNNLGQIFILRKSRADPRIASKFTCDIYDIPLILSIYEEIKI
jgi:hypothetical protein